MNKGDRLMALLDGKKLLAMPCAFDALSAKIIYQGGVPATLMSGFAVSGSRLGMPDTGLISFAEMRDQVANICAAAPDLLVLADGDTGYGNAINAMRTVSEYARAGAAAVMIEDQVSPKRCGHTKGKSVVERGEARQRIRASVEAARASGVKIIARTDARGVLGVEEAIERIRMFEGEGADILFPEAPENEREMEQFCRAVKGPCMANMVEGGKTPFLTPDELLARGFKLAVFPMIPFGNAIHAMQAAVKAMVEGKQRPPEVSFEQIKTLVGFPDYYALEDRFKE